MSALTGEKEEGPLPEGSPSQGTQQGDTFRGEDQHTLPRNSQSLVVPNFAVVLKTCGDKGQGLSGD